MLLPTIKSSKKGYLVEGQTEEDSCDYREVGKPKVISETVGFQVEDWSISKKI